MASHLAPDSTEIGHPTISYGSESYKTADAIWCSIAFHVIWVCSDNLRPLEEFALNITQGPWDTSHIHGIEGNMPLIDLATYKLAVFCLRLQFWAGFGRERQRNWQSCDLPRLWWPHSCRLETQRSLTGINSRRFRAVFKSSFSFSGWRPFRRTYATQELKCSAINHCTPSVTGARRTFR